MLPLLSEGRGCCCASGTDKSAKASPLSENRRVWVLWDPGASSVSMVLQTFEAALAPDQAGLVPLEGLLPHLGPPDADAAAALAAARQATDAVIDKINAQELTKSSADKVHRQGLRCQGQLFRQLVVKVTVMRTLRDGSVTDVVVCPHCTHSMHNHRTRVSGPRRACRLQSWSWMLVRCWPSTWGRTCAQTRRSGCSPPFFRCDKHASPLP